MLFWTSQPKSSQPGPRAKSNVNNAGKIVPFGPGGQPHIPYRQIRRFPGPTKKSRFFASHVRFHPSSARVSLHTNRTSPRIPYERKPPPVNPLQKSYTPPVRASPKNGSLERTVGFQPASSGSVHFQPTRCPKQAVCPQSSKLLLSEMRPAAWHCDIIPCTRHHFCRPFRRQPCRDMERQRKDDVHPVTR